MPTVFQPGERPSQPLDPEACVYTTAQKVGNILQIPPADPVSLAADANATDTSIDVSPIDLRSVGFEVGDEIEIESDASLVESRTITAITLVGGNARLSFASGLAYDHTTATKATVRNTASFTNGKLRGVSRKHVEHLIKVHQDRIDNITNNAWRPMLQTAEYKTFDTYKPYRRRYYTDYVGTTPLLFRNVQQILRLEVWQGSDYKELAAAEIRMAIKDYSALDSEKIFLCSGGGGIFELAQGTSNGNQWKGEFNNAFTAQEIADLINKDGRKGKNAINASPSYNLSDSHYTNGTIQANVHHEFLASANADYGNGKIKLTSMRRAQGGETSTIASTDIQNIEFSQMSTPTTNVVSVFNQGSHHDISVSSTSGFSPYGLLMVGSGTSVAVMRYEYIQGNTFHRCYNLAGDAIGDLQADPSGPIFQYKLQIDYQSANTDGDEARLRDWWFDSEMGIIYFNNSYPFFEWNAVKVSYVYGERYVEKAIEECTTKLVAMDLITADDRSVLIPEGTTNIDLGSKFQLFKQSVAETLPRYTEVMNVL
jgi:hypothetical protein